MEWFTPEIKQQIEDIRAMIATQTQQQKKRGPNTPEGKARSSQNARKHGLTSSKSIVVDPRDTQEYARYREAMFQSLAPQNEAQKTIVDIIVQSAWRLKLFTEIEADYMRENLEDSPHIHTAFTRNGPYSRIDALGRYRGSIERSLHRAFDRLATLQAQPNPTPEPS